MKAVTFLTGASSGVGAALAPMLAEDGHILALAARRTERLEALADQINDNGGTALAIPLDVTDRDAVHAAVERCEQELGPVECLVSNAGIDGFMPVHKYTAERIQQVMDVNFFGAVYCIEAVVHGMMERKRGHIVATSSIAGFRGLPLYSPYSASKGALDNMLESLRIELRQYKVAVTTLRPGFFKSPMSTGSNVPMPFMMELDDTAKTIRSAIRTRKRVATFPWPLRAAAWFASNLPPFLYDFPLSRVTRRRKK